MERMTKAQVVYRGVCAALNLDPEQSGTQKAVLAACTGIVRQQSALSGWKLGKRPMRDGVLEALCERFGLAVTYCAQFGWVASVEGEE